jgi:hypothetical protein
MSEATTRANPKVEHRAAARALRALHARPRALHARLRALRALRALHGGALPDIGAGLDLLASHGGDVAAAAEAFARASPQSAPPGAVKRPQRFPTQIGFVWGFYAGAQGA